MSKILILLVFASITWGMERSQVECYVGNRTAVVGGVASTTRDLGSFPLCTITVFLTGTSTLATIYSDNSSTALANPFTANANGHGYFYAANGRYDVRVSNGNPSFPTPITYGDILLFDPANFVPPITPVIITQNMTICNVGGFCNSFITNPSQTTNITYTLPITDGAGCLTSDGMGHLTWGPCGGTTLPGTPVNSIQVNRPLGTFGGSANFIWDNTLRRMTANGLVGTASIYSDEGYIQSDGGFLSTVPSGSYQGFNSATDGAFLRGYGVVQNAANNHGGYIDFAPVTYNPYNSGSQCIDEFGNVVTQPLPLNGLASFGAHDTIMWVSTSPVMPSSGSCGVPLPVDLDYGLNINSYMFARGGFASDQPSFNSFHSLRGGVTALAFTAGGLYNTGTVTACCGTLGAPTYIGGYVQIGHSTGPPATGTISTVNNPITQFGGLVQGTMYWDDALACVNVYNGSVWSCLGSSSVIFNPGATFTNSGSVIASGAVTYVTRPQSCTIGGYIVWADTGTVTFDVWKKATGSTAVPTVANTIISGSSYLALSTGTYLKSTSVSALTTTAVAAYDVFGFKLQAVTGSPTQAHVELICQ